MRPLAAIEVGAPYDSNAAGAVISSRPISWSYRQVRSLDDARPVSEVLARAIQGVELIRHSTVEVVDAFVATRLGAPAGAWGTLFGTMGSVVSKAQADIIVERAQVVR